jgi:hypothetical protein
LPTISSYEYEQASRNGIFVMGSVRRRLALPRIWHRQPESEKVIPNGRAARPELTAAAAFLFSQPAKLRCGMELRCKGSLMLLHAGPEKEFLYTEARR